MTLTIRSCKNAVAPTLAALMLIAAATSAHAVVVHIDPSRSSVTYTPGGIVLCGPDGDCGSLPEPQTFTLSGSFDVVRETVSYPVWFDPSSVIEREEIRFDTLAVDSGGASALGFSFPTYRGVMSGEIFTGSDDLCAFLPSMGGCFSMPPIAGFSGTFDGIALSMTGTAYTGTFFPHSFGFTVVARAVGPLSVPEPGTLACLAVTALSLSATRRRGCNSES